MRWIRRRYGAHPVHLLLMLACFALAVYALTRMRDQTGLVQIVVLFGAALVAHDVFGWPLYTWADLVAQRFSGRKGPRRRPRVPWINHLRVPAVIAGTLLVISFPLVLQLSHSYYAAVSGVSEFPYVEHWLLVTAVLFAGSAFIYILRVAWARRTKLEPEAEAAAPGDTSELDAE